MIELSDIQGLLIRGHAEMPYVSYVMLKIDDSDGARRWLKNILPDITPGNSKPEQIRYHIAFTHKGLGLLYKKEIPGFLVEYTQGMHTEFRSRILGDLQESDPKSWNWGGPENEDVHVVFMIFARSKDIQREALSTLEQDCGTYGLTNIIELEAPPNPSGREHFGFRDGITQPIIPGLSKTGRPENTVAAGEFVLGYKNGYEQFPESPLVQVEDDPSGILPGSEVFQGYNDLGKNGSYMVFRQIAQDVAGFWDQAKSAADQMGLSDVSCIYAASKMMGRWPDGKPLSKSPDGRHEGTSDDSYFLFLEEDDQHGFKCPLGAHIRRTNPRDVLPDNNPESSVKISNLHRILRRGRSFGPPLVESMNPSEIKDTPNDGKQRGLHFICFNTNIARQFEFVQHMWCNNPKFAGQYNDPDPVLGSFDKKEESPGHDFTIQAQPVRKKVHGLEPATHVVGGAYFFMPGLRALKFLANQ